MAGDFLLWCQFLLLIQNKWAFTTSFVRLLVPGLGVVTKPSICSCGRAAYQDTVGPRFSDGET